MFVFFFPYTRMEMCKAQKRRFPLVFSSDFCKYNKRKRNEFEQNKTNNTKRVKRNGLWNERAPPYTQSNWRHWFSILCQIQKKNKKKTIHVFLKSYSNPFSWKGISAHGINLIVFLMLFRQISLLSTPLFLHTFIFPSKNTKKPKLLSWNKNKQKSWFFFSSVMIQLSHRIFHVYFRCYRRLSSAHFQQQMYSAGLNGRKSSCAYWFCVRKEERERVPNLNFIDDSLSCWRKQMTYWRVATSASEHAAAAPFFSLSTSYYMSMNAPLGCRDCVGLSLVDTSSCICLYNVIPSKPWLLPAVAQVLRRRHVIDISRWKAFIFKSLRG